MHDEIIAGFRLSPQQEHLWLLQEAERRPCYRAECAVEIDGVLDLELFQAALQQVVERHEILRTTFRTLPEMTLPLQVINERGGAAIQLHDLSDLDAQQQIARSAALLQAARELPREGAQDQPLHLTLLRLAPDCHRLLAGLPALYADSIAFDNLIREIGQVYAALKDHQELPDAPVQYVDLSEWQNELLEAEETEAGRAYWRGLDLAPLATLRLPFESEPAETDGFEPAVLTAALPPSSLAGVAALARRYDLAPPAILLACWQMLLWRLGGQPDVIVGMGYDGRKYQELEAAIGLFARYLPIRCHLEPHPTLDTLLHQIRQATEEAHTYQESFAWDQIAVAGASGARLAFWPFCFDYQEPAAPYAAAALRFSIEERYVCFDRFKLKLTCIAGAGALRTDVAYDARVFAADEISRLADRFHTLVASVVRQPEAPIGSFAILSDAERRQVLLDFNRTVADEPRHACIHALFEEQVRRTPDQIAVAFQEQRLTYAELNGRANQLAHHLRGLGVGAEVPVAICMRRSVELVVGLLGILKAGGAYVPLDPSYPQERLQFMLADAQATVLLTARGGEEERGRRGEEQTQILPLSPSPTLPLSPSVVDLTTDRDTIAQEPETDPVGGAAAGNLAYVIYTSGSTGTPKGVQISHRNLVHSTAARMRFYAEPVAAFLLLSSFAFDSSVAGIFWTLCQGGSLVLPEEDFQQEPAQLVELIDRRRISHMLCLPSLYGLLLDQAQPGQLATLRGVVVAGEACPAGLVARHHGILPDTALFNEYGPTEGTVWSSVHTCAPQPDGARVPIGRPIANTQIYLLDEQMEPVPLGVAGELYIGGAGLARGYLNRPDLTAERFVPCPWSVVTGQLQRTTDNGQLTTDNRLYKTGDLARHLPDGTIEFLGRIDQQVKLRGYRIELGEIEAVLAQHGAVREAAVLAREDVAGDMRLVAYIVAGDWRLEIRDSPLNNLQSPISNLQTELRDYLKTRLPDYMIPAAFVTLEALPLMPNGKVDRRALPAPDAARPAPDETFVAPRTPIEELLAGIWSDVLGIESVGVHHSFFDLGGHSLLVTQVMSRVRETLGVEMPMRSLFEAPTVARLAERIQAAQVDSTEPPPPIVPIARDGALPLSFAQQRLWFLDQLEPESPIYNLPAAVRLSGPLDAGALHWSLSEIVRRHEVLRTTFPALHGEPAQVIAPVEAQARGDAGRALHEAPLQLGGRALHEAPLPMPVVDLQALAEPEREAAVLRLAGEEAVRPFDLARGPLLRATLLRLGAADHVVLLNMHHIVSDAWSVGVFIREIAALYAAFGSGQPPALADLPIQYVDFAHWQRQWLQDGDGPETSPVRQQLDYWKRQLAGLTTLELPTDHPRPPALTFRGASQSFALAPGLSAELMAASRREGVTLFMLLLAAFQALLARYSGQHEIVIGTTIANRGRAETEPLIGFFLNTLALRADASGNPTFREFLGRVREVCLGAYAHQDLPFEQVVEALQPDRDLSRHPLFQVSFTLEQAAPAIDLAELKLSPVPVAGTTTKFDLSLSVKAGTAGLTGGMLYSTDLFQDDTITRMIGHFQMLLEGIATNPDCRISALPILTEAEQHTLAEWNVVRTAPPPDRLVHQLFEAQAARVPDDVALVFGAERLTYRELNTRANQLAHTLRAIGVGPEVRVGVCMERSTELAVALLAIFKAGGAYVPLDPDYPPERLAFMLEDSQASVLLTEREIGDWRLEIDATEKSPISNLQSPVVVNLDAERERIAQAPETNPAGLVDDGDLAYLIYTSGTTGRPKAVMVEHGNLSNTLLAVQARFGFDGPENLPCIAPFSFDIVLFELMTPLLLGGTCFLLTRQQVLDVIEFAGVMREVTLLHTTPGLMRQFVNYVRDNRLQDHYTHIRRLFVGGDLIPVELVKDMQELFPAAQPYIGYGPTEGAIISTLYRVPAGTTVRRHVIGTPLNNMIVRIYDPHQNLVPVGVPGELYIGGSGVVRGYLGRPELTADRFVPDPFGQGRLEIRDWRVGGASSPISNLQSPISGRMYRSGDLARFLPDGTVEFLGRIDQQVKLRGFRIELGEIETILGQHGAVRACAVVVREDVPGTKRLVAYVVAGDWRLEIGDSTPDNLQSLISNLQTELRDYLKTRLPDYMIPAAFVTLEALPLTPNGKLDRKGLPAPAMERPEDATFVAPRTPAEVTLAGIWAQVLRLARVGVHDNFFALGGDSILSIQIIARARQAGLHLTPKQLFQHQTVAALAAVAGTTATAQGEQGFVGGPVPLTPAQQAFFDRDLPAPQHFNQALLLSTRRPLDPALLARALDLVLAHHDALRLRFIREERWRQQHAEAGEMVAFEYVDLSSLPAAEQGPAITAASAEQQVRLDLAAGPLLRAALFELGPDQPQRLLLVVHHLAVDGVSWRVLLEDLELLCRKLHQGAAHPTAQARLEMGDWRLSGVESPISNLQLPPKTTSFQGWADRLVAYAQSAELLAERDYWLAVAQLANPPLPRDYAEGANAEDSARTVQVALDEEETQALLTEVPRAYHTQINDVLLTALAQAAHGWTGMPRLLVDLEGHGREDLFADVDLSRTVGWFTARYPLLLDLAGAQGPGVALQAIKEQVRQVPNRGIGYGVLRYLNPDPALREALAADQAQISFNYLGQVDQVVGAEGLFGGAAESPGPTQDPRGQRTHLLDVGAIVAGGLLRLTWTYSEAVHERATIEGLAQSYLAMLRDLIAHCRSSDAGGFTPSDFPLARLNQATLARLIGGDRRVEDIYPLSPMQQGMLFHTLYEADLGTYAEHLSCTLHGQLDVAAFKQAWQRVVDRHAIFRTSFVWEGLAKPLQIVWRQAALEWEEGDWRELPPEEQTTRLDAFMRADHARGFVLSQAPLMRLALFQVADDAYAFVWNHHHLLLDGWSLPLVLREVFTGYAAFRQGRELALTPPHLYRDYIAWLQRQDLAGAEAFWRQYLQDVNAPTPLGIDRLAASAEVEERYQEQQHRLSEPATAGLKAFARRYGLTLNTLAQGAWALLLGRYSGATDVVFGVTVAGRPAELPGSEQMIGMFINTLPVRVPLTASAAALDWLRQLQEQQAELRQYEYSPLVQVQGWSAAPRGVPLFESILVFENYPVDEAVAAQNSHRSLAIRDVRAIDRNTYPLTLGIGPGPELALTVVYDSRRFEGAAIERMLGHYQQLLEGLAADPERSIADLPLLTEAERARVLLEWSTPDAAPATPQLIHELLSAVAARTPEAPALRCGAQALTYAALDARANRLAHHLQSLGVGPDTLVALGLPRSIDLIVALLATLKAGGAFLPLDLAAPPARLAAMIADSGAALLVTLDELGGELPTGWLPLVCLDADAELIAALPDTAPATTTLIEHLAYVIYTSGSTGVPKGVAVAHRGLATLVAAQAEAFPVTVESRVLQFASPAFDAAIAEILVTLGAGATLVLAEGGAPPLGPALLGLLRSERITTVTLPPALLTLLDPTDLPELATVVAAGEACPAVVVARWGIGRRFVNAYGPTEASVCATLGECLPGEAVTIGRPLAGSLAYVLDEAMQPLPIGVAGELYLGGQGLARGYLGRPDLTAERFVPNPFAQERLEIRDWRLRGAQSPISNLQSPIPGRLYKTGDRVRWRSDGTLEYLGRVDQQVKLRGFRIELGEIEAALRGHAAVRDAVVVTREDVPGETRLVAYLVPGDWRLEIGDSTPDNLQSPISNLQTELRAFLKQRLPEYMIPAAFVPLEALPLAPSGKVDRAALPAPDTARPGPAETFVAPRNPIEATLAALWSEAFGLEQVGVEDNFFDLGGHSMLAMQIFVRIGEAFQLDLPLKMFLDAPTVAALAEKIARYQIEQASTADIATMLQEMDDLSEEEIEAFLAGEMPVVGE